MNKRIAIVGGCGHVGLPLGLALAEAGARVSLLDTDIAAVEAVSAGRMPFLEEGAGPLLERHVGRSLVASTRAQILVEQEVVIFVTGRENQDAIGVVAMYAEFLKPSQLIVLRSTVAPGTTRALFDHLVGRWGSAKVAFCPERIAQGRALAELRELPQLVSAESGQALTEALEIFSALTPKTPVLDTREAELAKLMTNAWRYLEFAIANQFYEIAESAGCDFHRIRAAVVEDYPRAAGFARPGLTAGPCLLKDTKLLADFAPPGAFALGSAAVAANEGMVPSLVAKLEGCMGGLRGRRVALLGLTFKAESDDLRESLAVKIREALREKGAEVLVCDPYRPETLPLGETLELAEGAILGTPHRAFRDLRLRVPFVDCWNLWGER